MNYQINIQGMHCDGCKNLIGMCLSELDLQNIKVDLNSNTATFETEKPLDELNLSLIKLFDSELTHYKFTGLKIL